MPSCSFPSTCGTGTPHVRSRVTGLGRNPAFRRSSMSLPSALMTAFGDHLPSFADFLIHSSVRGCRSFRRMYMCAVVRVVTECVLSTKQRGLMSSTASRVLPQTSHWSPRASWRNCVSAAVAGTQCEYPHRSHNEGTSPLRSDLQGI